MTLRARLALATGLCAAVAVLSISAAAWLFARHEVMSQIDTAMRQQAGRLRGDDPTRPPRPGPPESAETRLLDTSGSVRSGASDPPVSPAEAEVARGDRTEVVRDADVGGATVRILTVPIPTGRRTGGPTGGAVQILRPIDDALQTVTSLAWILGSLAVGGVALSVVAGSLVARRALRPVSRLTATAERVAREQRLDETIPVEQDDEIGRLATSLNTMLSALAESRDQQQRLVSDASHELRTPLTTLRANIDLLRRSPTIPPVQQREMLDDSSFELSELTHLVTELVDLATDARSDDAAPVDLRLDRLVDEVAARTRRRSGLRIEVRAQECVITARPAALERAIRNLLDNAVKWSPPGGTITVTLGEGRLTVEDEGPGIAPSDLPLIFDRFHRGADTAGIPGSGLGLSIVRQVAEDLGGTVFAGRSRAGGASVGMLLRVDPLPG